MALSVRPGTSLAISAHLLPNFVCASRMVVSSFVLFERQPHQCTKMVYCRRAVSRARLSRVAASPLKARAVRCHGTHLVRPRGASDVWVELIVPSLSNLLGCARGQVHGHLAPAAKAKSLHHLPNEVVFFWQPGQPTLLPAHERHQARVTVRAHRAHAGRPWEKMLTASCAPHLFGGPRLLAPAAPPRGLASSPRRATASSSHPRCSVRRSQRARRHPPRTPPGHRSLQRHLARGGGAAELNL
jgi:hypothetical protein